jgi:PPOX class probable F420-dependent enzyme
MVTAKIKGWARELLQRPGAFGTLATLSPDGSPHLAVVWYLVRGDTIVINSAVGRIWPTNLLREPRCSMLVELGYEWVSVSGQVDVVSGQAEAQADIAAMARRYNQDDPERAERMIRFLFQAQERISFVLHPLRVAEHPEA